MTLEKATVRLGASPDFSWQLTCCRMIVLSFGSMFAGAGVLLMGCRRAELAHQPHH